MDDDKKKQECARCRREWTPDETDALFITCRSCRIPWVKDHYRERQIIYRKRYRVANYDKPYIQAPENLWLKKEDNA